MAASVTREGSNWSIENEHLRITADTTSGTLAVLDKASGHAWRQAQPGPPFRNARELQSPASGIAFEADFPAGEGKPETLTVALTAPAGTSDLVIEAHMSERDAEIEFLWFLSPFVLDSPDAVFVCQERDCGHLLPLDSTFPGWGYPGRRQLPTWDMDMPWVGVCDLSKGFGYALILDTPDDAIIRLQSVGSPEHELLAPQVGWAPSHGKLGYPRRVIYHFAPNGGYVALAKRYRSHARDLGLLATLAEKAKRDPDVERLFGAPIVWGGDLEFARAAKAAGVDRMVFYGGFGSHVSPEDVARVSELGYLTSAYDNYTDIRALEPGQEVSSNRDVVPDHAVLQADGERMRAWTNWDGTHFLKRCPTFWLPAAQTVIPKDLARCPRLARFIDVSTVESLYECYDPHHPLTRTQKRQCGVDLLEYCRSLGLVLGGEHARWWSVPHLEYSEGTMSGGWDSWPSGHLLRPESKDQQFTHPSGYQYAKWEDYEKWGIGHGSRVPLWELVFHDCVVTTWYWGDSNDFLLKAAPEITARKDAFNILYGTVPMMWASDQGSWQLDRDAFLRTYRNTCKLHEAIAGTDMLTHEFLTPDRAVQRTEFSDGTVVIVNFGEQPYQAELAGKTYLLPQNGFAVKGPRIEQSLTLVDGRSVTTIRTADYSYTDAE